MFRVSALIPVILALACALVGPAVVHAQASTPVPHLPAATAPLGLGTVMLPYDATGVAELFARLPATVADQPRAPTPDHGDDRVFAAYGTVDPNFGAPLSLQVLNFTAGDFFPRDFTAADFVASAAGTTDYDAVAFGQDGTLVWVRAETTVGVAGNKPGTPTVSRMIYTLAWGEATSSLLFGAAAFSPENLDALVGAFVTAAKSQPGTPTTEAAPAAVSWRQVDPSPAITAQASRPSMPSRKDFIARYREAGATEFVVYWLPAEIRGQRFYRYEAERLTSSKMLERVAGELFPKLRCP